MRFKTWDELRDECSSDHAYRIDVVVFDTETVDDCDQISNWEYWFDEERDIFTHPFECFFDSFDEAVEWCRCFNEHAAQWTHNHGNGVNFDHVAIDVLEMEHDEYHSNYVPNVSVATFDWMFGTSLEEWFFEEIAQRT